jgi:uncharacterized protein YukE
MTVEERFERIEHVTAALVEERRKDREEYRQLWRETNQAITRLAEESRAADARLEQRIDRVAEEVQNVASELRQYAAESRAADQRLGDRIESLVSAFGKFLAK